VSLLTTEASCLNYRNPRHTRLPKGSDDFVHAVRPNDRFNSFHILTQIVNF
jgi:hypothetical protein